MSNFLWMLIAHILWGSCNLVYMDLRYRLNGVVFITQRKYTNGVLNLNFQRPSIISHHIHLPHRGSCYNLTVLNLPNQVQSLCQYDATTWLKNCCDAAGDSSKTGSYYKKHSIVNKYVTRGCRNSVRNIEATSVLPALLQQ